MKFVGAIALSLFVMGVASTAQAAMSQKQAVEECKVQAKAERLGRSGRDSQAWMKNCIAQKMKK